MATITTKISFPTLNKEATGKYKLQNRETTTFKSIKNHPDSIEYKHFNCAEAPSYFLGPSQRIRDHFSGSTAYYQNIDKI